MVLLLAAEGTTAEAQHATVGGNLTAGGGLILDGVGRLLSDTRIFVFEVLNDTKNEIQEIYGGIRTDQISTSSGSWCVDGAILIPDEIAAGYLEADPQAPR